MRKIVIYGSKYGATKICANYLKERYNIDVIDIEENPSIKEYDEIIFGTSTYASTYHKKITQFCSDNMEILLRKRVSLYVCGLNDEIINDDLKKNFDAQFIEHFHKVVFAGGILDFSRMNFFEKSIIRLINKKAHFIEQIDNSKSYDLLRLSNLDDLM